MGVGNSPAQSFYASTAQHLFQKTYTIPHSAAAFALVILTKSGNKLTYCWKYKMIPVDWRQKLLDGTCIYLWHAFRSSETKGASSPGLEIREVSHRGRSVPFFFRVYLEYSSEHIFSIISGPWMRALPWGIQYRSDSRDSAYISFTSYRNRRKSNFGGVDGEQAAEPGYS